MMEVEKPEWRPGTGICRCCLSDGCYKDISGEYFWQGEKEVYADMLLDTFDLTISYQDVGTLSNSRLICDACIARLRDATHFKKLVVDSENKFSQITAGKLAESLEAGTFKEVKVENIKGEMVIDDDDIDNVEYLEEHLDDDDEDNQPLQRFASNETKKEIDIDFSEELSVKKSATKTGKRKYTKKSVTPAKKSKSSKKEPTEEKPSGSKGSAKKGERTSMMERLCKQMIDDPKTKENILKAWSNQPKSKNSNRSQTKSAIRVSKFSFSLKNDETYRFTANVIQNAEAIINNSTAYPFRLLNSLLRCVYCHESFNVPQLWRTHITEQHPDSRFRDFMNTHKRYERTKIDINGARCRICSAELATIDTLVDHLTEEHKILIERDTDYGVMAFNLTLEDLRCLICNDRYPNIMRLSSHVAKHYQDFICHVCGKGFLRAEALSLHTREHETNVACKKCPAQFDTYDELKNHMKEHKFFRCRQCGDLFKNYYDRVRHMTDAHGHPAPLYPCKVCAMTFNKKDSCYQHYITNHAPKTYVCPHCDARFNKQLTLNNHMVKHSGEKKFHCSVCGKNYPRKKSLNYHMRIHNNDRRYVCAICGQAFVQNCSLKGHMRSHHAHHVYDVGFRSEPKGQMDPVVHGSMS